MKYILENRETKLAGKVRNIIIAFILLFVWINIMYHLLQKVRNPELFSFTSPSIWYNLLTCCILAPLWEELVFRVAPISIAKSAGKQYIFPTIIISSFIFGSLHLNSPHPILFQGVMGFVFSLVYIKNNYSYWSAVVLHSMWNSYVFMSYVI